MLITNIDVIDHIVHVVLDKEKFFAVWIPKYLEVDQKRANVEASPLICIQFEKDTDFFSCVVTMDDI